MVFWFKLTGLAEKYTKSYNLYQAYVLFLSVTLTLSEVEFTRGE